MKANNLLEEIKTNIKDCNIDYLKNKVTDDRYKDPLTKSLAKYNSEAYDEIFQLEISEDFDYYFSRYNPHDEENQNLTRNLSLYFALISKKPLHPFGLNTKKDDVYKYNDNYFCKGKSKYIKEHKSLCRYCICKKAPFEHLFL